MKSIRIGKYFLVIVSMFWATPQALADTLEFANGQTMQTEHINPAETANNFQYGIVKINYTSAAVTKLTLPQKENLQIVPDALFTTEAHASLTPIDQNILTVGHRAHEALRTALRLEDVRPFLTTQAYQVLVNKRNAGSKELLILQLLKSSIPEDITIIQTQLNDNTATVLARGRMNGEDFWGTLILAKEEGQWKLSLETWYGNQNTPIIIENLAKAENFLNQINDRPANNFITWADAVGRPKSTLPLEYGRIRTPKKSFCLFFFIDPEKSKKKNTNDLAPIVTATPSPDLHIVWPSNVRHDPKVYEGDNDEGFDVSIAADKDGYYPNKINLRMPKGKPREVYVGLLVAF